MFENLSNRFSYILKNLVGKAYIRENDFKNILKEVKEAMIESDVALPVVSYFIMRIREKILGKKIDKFLNPSQQFVKYMHEEIVNLIKKKKNFLNLNVQVPSIILLVGLQGSGKTTTVGKIGKYIKEKNKKKILVVSSDIYRPAAIDQLKILSKLAGIDFFSKKKSKPIDIISEAFYVAKSKSFDVMIIDTPGFLDSDVSLIKEIVSIHSFVNPIETLFVADATMGQNASKYAKNFIKILPLTGIVLTKTDSDTRGGAALSISYITNKPIKFIGTGEKLNELEICHPERLANRILGMGDMLSLIEEIENKFKQNGEKEYYDFLKKKNEFNLNHFLQQLKYTKDLGGIDFLIKKLPNSFQLYNNKKLDFNEKILFRMEAIINSMTKKERFNPKIIKKSHKSRIAKGAGVSVKDVNNLLRKFFHMQVLVKKIKENKIVKMIDNIKNFTSFNFFNKK